MIKHYKMKYVYVGIDCHKKIHVATMINCFNEKIFTHTFNNDIIGYESLIKKVDEQKGEFEVVFALEDINHLGYELSSYLTKRNCLVKYANSNLTASERKKFAVISKNDDIDSGCIAKVLLDEFENLPTVENNDESYWSLKQLVQMRQSIVDSNVELKNKLHAQIMHHYPNYHTLFCETGGNTALQFWYKYPSPNLLKDVSIYELQKFLHECSKGKVRNDKAIKIKELVNTYDMKDSLYQEHRNTIVRVLVEQIQNNNEKLENVQSEILKIYSDIGKKLHTIPCINMVASCQILAEIGNIERFATKDKLAKYSGISPIEHSSGGTEKANKNNYGNRQLHGLIYKVACRSLSTGINKGTPYNAIFLEYYQKKINEGKTSRQAIICIMRRIINIIYVVLKNDKEYVHPTELSNECTQKFLSRKQELEQKEKEKQAKKHKHKQKV